MAALVCLVGLAQDASATVTFDLIWTATTGYDFGLGTSEIWAAPGDVITLSIRMTTDQTLAAHGVSLRYDTALLNELNLFRPWGGKEWGGTTYGTTTMISTYDSLALGLGPPPAVESTTSTAGRINTFESGKHPTGAFLPVGTYIIGTVRFVSTGARNSFGPDVFIGLFNTGVDDVLNNSNLVIPESALIFGTASMALPEPGTFSLLGLGLVGLVLARRRGRH